jgi:large conductance mechanosensitive channel
MLKEFKEFAMRGGLIDTAVGLVMAAAFGKVTSAFIDGMFMPLVSTIIQTDFKKWKSVLTPAVAGADGKIDPATEIAISYGDFVASIINFIVVAFVMFLIIKAMNASKKNEPAPPPPPPPAADVLLGEIRDLLKSGR